MNRPNIRQRIQETLYRALPPANKSSILTTEEGVVSFKELANGHYIVGLAHPVKK